MASNEGLKTLKIWRCLYFGGRVEKIRCVGRGLNALHDFYGGITCVKINSRKPQVPSRLLSLSMN